MLVVACAAETGDRETTAEPTAPPPSHAPTATSSTHDAGRPAFDAGFPADKDPEPPHVEECLDPNDPGSTETAAKELPNIDDCDGSAGKITGTLKGAADTDFYKFVASDTWLCSVNPKVSSQTPGLEVCMFVSCLKGTTEVSSCSGGGAKVTSSIGTQGCCVAAPGSTEPYYNCADTSDETANVFLRVRQINADKCTAYSVDYNF